MDIGEKKFLKDQVFENRPFPGYFWTLSHLAVPNVLITDYLEYIKILLEKSCIFLRKWKLSFVLLLLPGKKSASASTSLPCTCIHTSLFAQVICAQVWPACSPDSIDTLMSDTVQCMPENSA